MRKFIAFVFLVPLVYNLQAQFNLKGLVLSSTSYAVISNCTIVLNNDEGSLVQKVFTDKNGYFMLNNIKAGRYALIAYELGYQPAEIKFSLTQSKLDFLIELKPLHVVSDEVIVEGIRSKKTLKTTFTNLDKANVERLNFAQDLPVILSTTASTVSTSDAGAGVGYSGVRIRGVDATRVNVTLNGVPFNDAESHSVYWVDLPDLAGSVNSIQVQRGIGTSTNGSAAFGSSINIETTKSSIDPYAQFSSVYGSFNTLKSNVKFGTGILKSHWSLEGSLSQIKSDGYIDRASSNLKSSYGSLTRYGDKSLLKFIVMSGAETTYQAWDGVPQDSLEFNRTHNSFTYKNQTDNYNQTHYQLIFNYVLNNRLNINTVAHYTKGKGYYESYYPLATLTNYGLVGFLKPDSTLGTQTDLVARKWLDNDFYGVVTSLAYKLNKLELNGGLSMNNYLGLHYHEVIWSDVWTAPKPSNLYEPYRYYDDKGAKLDGNIYGKMYYNFTKRTNLFVDIQLRILSYNYNDINRQNRTQDYRFFNPKIGLNHSFKDSSSLLFYVGRSAHEPTRDEFVNSNDSTLPKAEFLTDIEIGYSKQFKLLHLIANFYSMSYNNQLVLTGKINDVGNPIRENVLESYRRGLELIVERNFEGGLYLNANITYSQNKIINYTEYMYSSAYDTLIALKYASTPISFSPNLIFGSSIRFTTKEHFEVEVISKYVGKQFIDNSGSNDRMLNAYFINDLYIRYRILNNRYFDNLMISGVMYNVFNTVYESNGYTYGNLDGSVRTSYNFYYPQALQNFALMFQIRF